MKKLCSVLALGALALACTGDASPDFQEGRYVLVSLGRQPLPAGTSGFTILADTLVVRVNEQRATQSLHYVLRDVTKHARTDFPMKLTDGTYEIDFHCISGEGCLTYYAPEFGSIRGDTLQFVQRDSVTRTYLRR